MTWWNSLDAMTTIWQWCRVAMILFGLLTALSTLAEWRAARRLDELRTAKQLADETELRARLGAAEAEARDARRRVAEIAQQSQPRRLTKQQRDSIAASLKGKVSGRVEIVTPGDDPEAKMFGADIEQALRAAGLSVTTSINLAGIEGIGVQIQQRTEGSGTPLSNALRGALTAAGIENVSAASNSVVPVNITRVVIGHRR